jgi:hypothetical protein
MFVDIKLYCTPIKSFIKAVLHYFQHLCCQLSISLLALKNKIPTGQLLCCHFETKNSCGAGTNSNFKISYYRQNSYSLQIYSAENLI